MRQNNEEARRRARDTDSNWSTNTEYPLHGSHWVDELNPWEDDLGRDNWSGFVYKADQFTWKHKRSEPTCRWNFVGQTGFNRCLECGSRYVLKYPTFNSSCSLVSKLYMTTPCHHWFYFCTHCREFTDRKIHCNRECVDVYALKMDRQSRGRLWGDD